jgi:2-amino-4-hydroxy-6-hydroxymethyldihydropteridine diphosphokinase
MAVVYLGLGANLGDREANLRAALARLAAAGAHVVAVSSLYRSDAVVPPGEPPGPEYFNAAAAVETDLAPRELLALAKRVERDLGRRPDAPRWSARPIDIDLLLYADGRVVDAPDLAVPHPLMHERAFVLLPLVEVAPGVVHPRLRRRVRELASAVDPAGVERVRGPDWASDDGLVGGTDS